MVVECNCPYFIQIGLKQVRPGIFLFHEYSSHRPEWQMCIHILVMVRQTLLVFSQKHEYIFYCICQLTGQMFVEPTEYVHILTTQGDRTRKEIHTYENAYRESKIWLCMHNKITQQKWDKISPCTFELGYLK